MMGVFNNLVIFDQSVRQNTPKSIVPDLAPSWAWNEEGTELTMTLRQGIKWHDGKPFTAADVRCTLTVRIHFPPAESRTNSHCLCAACTLRPAK